jgi:hypothetical protein
MYEYLLKEQTLLMPLALAQGSNKAERLPANSVTPTWVESLTRGITLALLKATLNSLDGRLRG